MTKLEKIEEDVSNLPPEEMVKFRIWFDEFDAKLWDKQIEQDAEAGRLDDLAQQALKDHKAGRTREL